MPYTVFDYRADVKNLFVTPRIRSRFLRMEPGEVHRAHSHDLGHEIFLILDGECDMEIDGERAWPPSESAFPESRIRTPSDGEPVRIEGSHLLARAVQHEVDHLDGVLFVDRLDAEARAAALAAIGAAEWAGAGAWVPRVEVSPH